MENGIDDPKGMYNKPKKELTKAKKIWIGVGIGVAVLVILIAAVFGVGKDGDNGNDSGKSKFYIADTVVSDNLRIIVTDVYSTKRLNSLYYTSNNYVVVTVNIQNMTNSTYTVNANNFVLKDGTAKYEYDSSTLSIDGGMFYNELGPGLSKTYKLVFETPASHELREYSLVLDEGLLGRHMEIILKPKA